MATNAELLEAVDARILRLMTGASGGDIAEFAEASERVRYQNMSLTELREFRKELAWDVANEAGTTSSLGVPSQI